MKWLQDNTLEDTWAPLPRTEVLYEYQKVLHAQIVTIKRYATIEQPERNTIPAIPTSEHNLMDLFFGGTYGGSKVNRKNRN